MPLSFRKVHPDAIIPARKHEGDAGIDFYSIEDERIAPWSQIVIDTGIELVELPCLPLNGWDYLTQEMLGNTWKSVLQIWPKSGLDADKALHTGAGVIDCLYRGRVLILVKNQSDNIIMIRKGDPVAQGVVVPCYVGPVEESSEGSETERGKTGGIATFNGTTENFKDHGFTNTRGDGMGQGEN